MQDPLPRPPGGDYFVQATSVGIAYLCLILSVYGKSIKKISHNKKAGLWKDRLENIRSELSARIRIFRVALLEKTGASW